MVFVRRLSTAVLAAALCATGSGPAAAAVTPVPYGTGAQISTDTGRVEYTVSAPRVVVFHEDEYDGKSSSWKPGAVIASMVRVQVSVRGVSGEVDATSSVQLVYEAPDGLLAGTDVPPSAHEKTDLLLSKPSTLSEGQRIIGEVYFASKTGGGKVIASSGGRRQATWRP
ncbi:hypothetical protein [Actinoplanes utahensis]|uniref:DUF4352 domain-containing protein n=1 Tax=Actinoplanes utahensis TaxID=1869 RepID=A0A0A6X0U9_ACTUT|nr:hypothetical protein [Actinoplanes utahensis]KHD73652.1 hypothetical protein MB27_33285 [Actinoplanes utahensis]GIF34006.1 hypothetical protein Aut01nite_69920 [Actinoplanes utahensis]